MIKSLYLDYVALAVYALMVLAWFLRTKNSSRKRSVYFDMLAVAILANIYDIFTVLLDNTGTGAIVLKYIMNCGYLILRNLITPIYGAYIITVTNTWHKLYKRSIIQVLIWIPFSVAAILTLSSPATHLVFYIDEVGKYTRGPAFIVLYLSAVFYLIFCVYYCIKYYKVLKLDRFVPLFSIAPTQLIAVGVQLIYDDVLCEMFATAICLLLIMLTIEKPEEKVDVSTGMYKDDAFINMFIQASEVGKPCSVILINITNYLAISSYLSLTNIDSIYASIRHRLDAVKTHLHLSPEIYNLGNGLFAAVLYNNDINYGARYANHVLSTLTHDYNINGLTVSILPNVCVVNVPNDAKDVDEIRLLATTLRGRKYDGEITLASSIMKNNDFSVMANIDSIIKNAIKNDDFQVYYQPIYSNPDGRFNSAEALVRLNTIEYGFIRPDLFIPMAEESGTIHQIGMIVFEKVCQFIASDDFKKLNLDYIEVNLSVVQCMDKNLVRKISDMCNKYGVSPSQINLEITETASAYAQKNMMSNIEQLHQMGFSFSLDDFGTGYSNLVRIASLPLHIVKLDKSFTWTDNNAGLKLILENTISMVKKMDMKIVVEGVETQEMLSRFTELGCEYIQGYYFSKPLPQYDFVQYIIDSDNQNK